MWGLILFQLLNFVRILVLFLVEDGSLSDLLHAYLWPLVLVGAGCVSWFVWIAGAKAWAHRASTHRKAAPMPFPIPWQRALLFVGLVGLLGLLRSAVLKSPPTHQFAHAITSGAASLLCWVGTPTQATGPVITSGSTAIAMGAGGPAVLAFRVALDRRLLPAQLSDRGTYSRSRLVAITTHGTSPKAAVLPATRSGRGRQHRRLVSRRRSVWASATLELPTDLSQHRHIPG